MPKLNARKVDTIKKPGTYADGNGLYLRVTNTGTKSWIFRYQIDKKRRNMGLGTLADLSLADAREAASDAAKLARRGIDPLEQRRIKQAAESQRLAPTFEEFSRECIEQWRAGWKNPKHAQQWRNTLATYAYPIIGEKQLPEIDTEDVLQILKPIWNEKTETAHRVQGRIAKILSAAIARGYRQHPNPAAWADHLVNILPAPRKVKQEKHHAALPWQQMPEFMKQLRSYQAISAIALEFTILTATRTNEAIAARWEEIDFDQAIWTIPAERMKSGRIHRIPLSTASLNLLTNLPRISDYLFPGLKKNPHISNMSMLVFLQKRMNYPNITVHGFRSSFRDWVAEATAYPRELAEAALAHVVKDKAEAAYQRGDMLEKRRKLMQEWENHLERH